MLGPASLQRRLQLLGRKERLHGGGPPALDAARLLGRRSDESVEARVLLRLNDVLLRPLQRLVVHNRHFLVVRFLRAEQAPEGLALAAGDRARSRRRALQLQAPRAELVAHGVGVARERGWRGHRLVEENRAARLTHLLRGACGGRLCELNALAALDGWGLGRVGLGEQLRQQLDLRDLDFVGLSLQVLAGLVELTVDCECRGPADYPGRLHVLCVFGGRSTGVSEQFSD